MLKVLPNGDIVSLLRRFLYRLKQVERRED